MRGKTAWSIALMIVLLTLPPEALAQGEGPPPDEVPKPKDLDRPIINPGEAPNETDYTLEDGYTIRLVSGEMTFPTAIAFDDDGDVYVVEGGYSYGSATAIPRILTVEGDGTTQEVTRLPDGPITGLAHHNGSLYAVGGRDPAEVWRIDPDNGDRETILTGFPVWGHHFTSQLVFGPDDKLYFAVGMPTNAGVIGLEDFYEFQYLSIFPEARDIPCVRHVLVGQNFETPNPFTEDPDDTAVTGAFHRFGEPSEPGEVIEATPAPGCNGAVFRANPDGSDLEVYATGFRNPYGINFGPEGDLFLIDQGIDNGGSRPVANDLEPMWRVQEGGWYGFPDYPSGFPVTLSGFHGKEKPQPKPLLSEHPPLAGRPFFLLVPSCGCMQFDFSPGGAFGYEGQAFISEYGAQFHADRPGGFRIERLAMETKTIGDFYINKKPGAPGNSPERPISVAFHPQEDALYLLDFGHLATDTLNFFSSPLTGSLWVIEPEESSGGAESSTAQGTDTRSARIASMLLIAAFTGVALWSIIHRFNREVKR